MNGASTMTNDTQTLTLTDFLLVRIAEDESVGRDWRHHRGKVTIHGGGTGYGSLVDPARVLAECEAKRRIVEIHHPSTDHGDDYDPYCVGCWEDGGLDGAPTYPCRTLRAVALPYADHPDYRDDWRP